MPKTSIYTPSDIHAYLRENNLSPSRIVQDVIRKRMAEEQRDILTSAHLPAALHERDFHKIARIIQGIRSPSTAGLAAQDIIDALTATDEYFASEIATINGRLHASIEQERAAPETLQALDDLTRIIRNFLSGGET